MTETPACGGERRTGRRAWPALQRRRSGAGAAAVLTAWLSLGCAFLASIPGCQKDEPRRLILAPADCGWIQGRVSGALGPIPGRLEAQNADGSSTFVTWTDASGAYRIAVPHGQYLLRFYQTAGLGVLRYSGAGDYLNGRDTLATSPLSPVVEADFRLGAIRVDLRWPAELAGHNCRISATSVDARRTYALTSRSVIPDSLHTEVVLDGLPSGRGVVRLDTSFDNSSLEDVVLPDAEADSVEIRAGAVTSFGRDLPAACLVRATIRGSWPRLVRLGPEYYSATVSLEAWNADSVEVVGPTLIASIDGDRASFRVNLRGSGSYRFRLLTSQHAWWLGGSDFRSAREYTLQPQGSIDLPEIVESGLVCHLEPGAPVESVPVSVSLFDPEGNLVAKEGAPCGECIGVPGNVVVFHGLDAGSYSLRLERVGCDGLWFPCWYPEAPTRETGTPVAVPGDGQLVEMTWNLPRGGVIRGALSGSIAPVVRVVLCSAADTTNVLCSASVSDTQRRFGFSGLEDGDYLLYLMIYGSSSASPPWYPASWSAAGAETLRVRDHVGPEELSWVLR